MSHRKLISEMGLLLAAVLAIAVIIAVNSSITGIRLDLTENRLFTLSQGTVNIIRSLEEPVDLDFYLSRQILTEYPGIINYANRVRDLLTEYAARSDGMVRLDIIEPEPFSEAEDQAVASGLQGVPVNTSGDLAYFGLVGTNSIDNELVIPFFQNEKESSLEYDITKLIYNLANPEKRVIGVMSSLPVFGSMPPMQQMPQQPPRPWAIVNVMREFFEVRDLGMEVDAVDDDIDVLMVIHPKDPGDESLFAIDQYLLGGGKAMIFIDPMSDADNAQPDPQNPMVMPPRSSDLDGLLNHWGLEIIEGKVVTDISRAMRVQTRGPRGPEETLYLPWLQLDASNFNQEDFATNELNTVNIGSAGAIQQADGSGITLTALMQSTSDSMLIDSERLVFQPDPKQLLDEFVPDNTVRIIAARISGQATTAFPDGIVQGETGEADDDDAENPGSATKDLITHGNINAILVADTDLLNDYLWIRMQSFFGLEIPQTLANNGDFVINSLDNLSGNNDLISLRTRGNYSRPFIRVESIRRAAEAEFRDREQQLQARLEETEARLLELQNETGSSNLILSPEQEAEIERFRLEQINTRKELRNVQHELQKNIERLGAQLKFINIGLVPLLIAVAAVVAGYLRNRSLA